MSRLQMLYPLALAGLNLAVGWYLYQSAGLFLGLFLVMAGVFVLVAMVCGSANRLFPRLRTQS